MPDNCSNLLIKSVGYVIVTAIVPDRPPSIRFMNCTLGCLLSTVRKVFRMSNEAIFIPMYGVIPWEKTDQKMRFNTYFSVAVSTYEES